MIIQSKNLHPVLLRFARNHKLYFCDGEQSFSHVPSKLNNILESLVRRDSGGPWYSSSWVRKKKNIPFALPSNRRCTGGIVYFPPGGMLYYDQLGLDINTLILHEFGHHIIVKHTNYFLPAYESNVEIFFSLEVLAWLASIFLSTSLSIPFCYKTCLKCLDSHKNSFYLQSSCDRSFLPSCLLSERGDEFYSVVSDVFAKYNRDIVKGSV